MMVFAALTEPAEAAELNTFEILVLLEGMELIALRVPPEIDELIGLAGTKAAPEMLAPINRFKSFAYVETPALIDSSVVYKLLTMFVNSAFCEVLILSAELSA